MHQDSTPDQRSPAPSALPPSVDFRSSDDGPGGDGAQLSLEQVLAAGAQDFQSSLGIGDDEALDFEGLSDAVEQAQSALVSHLMSSGDGSDPVAKEREGGDGVDAEYLTTLIQLHEQAGGSTDLGRAGADPFHEASILLHATYRDPALSALAMGRAVDSVLGSVESTPAYYFIIRAVHDMANHATHEDFDRWLPAAMPTLRRCATPLIDRVTEAAVASTDHGKAALWPYAVDEMLVTLSGRKAGLDPRIHELDPLAMEDAVRRLAGLNAVSRQRLASGMFSMNQTFVHAIFVGLMKTSGRSLIGPILFEKFREFTPADPGVSLCMFAHRQHKPELDGILAEQLKDLRSPIGDKAQGTAAWLLVGALESLPSDRRGETWIPAALDWLGDRDASGDLEAQAKATVTLLQRVESERSGLKRTWNKECRQAAKRALRGGTPS